MNFFKIERAAAVNYSAAVFASIGLLLLLAIARLAFSGTRRNGGDRPKWSGRATGLHISHLPQIKQALTNSDFMYLKDQGTPRLPNGFERNGDALPLTILRVCELNSKNYCTSHAWLR